MNLNELALQIRKDNELWWTDLKTGQPLKRSALELIALVHSELSEALEGHRKGLMDDHLPHRRMEEVELADAAIRILDILGDQKYNLARCYRYNANISNGIRGLAGLLRLFDVTKPGNQGVATFPEVICILHHKLSYAFNESCWAFNCDALMRVLCYIASAGSYFGLDIDGALHEKLEYNKHRADHKAAARMAAGGKKF